MSHKIPMLSIIARGTKLFPRYIVAKADEYKNATYWTGDGWDGDENKAQMFSEANDALWVLHVEMVGHLSDRPSTKYVAPIHIEVFGAKPKLGALKNWLERTVRIVADFPRHGYGPDSDSVGVIVADFDRTRIVRD
ncbi:hypothetical protein FYZ48_25900 [Gimesia chilikensis]|uniref:hypothetical protein n=1 Tax=Gimesia chilikensis TaxID=2605989 RepID=UPI0011F03D80|nr:hypothetical protein [Gimesia chilikensis]KAA0131574.1 hypothetical protein FYZ48_25900 [Gimesia chilikensis]